MPHDRRRVGAEQVGGHGGAVGADDDEVGAHDLRFLQDFRITLDIDRLIAGAIERAAKARYQVI